MIREGRAQGHALQLTRPHASGANGADRAPSAVWVCDRNDGPLVAAAIHQGHELRTEVAALIALDEENRLREEDPLTGLWTHIDCTRIRVMRSRFEVDMNRPREKAVALDPVDAWGLRVWKRPPPPDLLERSRAEHDDFYRFLEQLIGALVERHGKVLVLDIHSYNHRRRGPLAPADDPTRNPEVNVGTGTLVRARWAPVIDRFMTELRAFDFAGRQLDVRENVKFVGGYFPSWLHRRFPQAVCTLSLEFKKFFMDEWSAQADIRDLESIRVALQSTVRGALDELGAH